ncbi:MAG TPA: glutamate ABC transporter substrate-binding protein [Acidimicrobiales bacterium]|nr:glutamate ABC transporter substrate-binding protein [Acidimicrobiales bacterium]
MSAPDRTSRRVCRVLAVVVAAVLLGACGTTSTISTTPAKPLVVLPKGAEIVQSSPPSATQSCNATASLAPPATMPSPGDMPTGSYMAQIQARGYLRVGVDDNTYLWGYRDPVTGTLSGFDIAMLQQVSQAIFGSSDPKYIRYVIVPNADRMQAVQDGEVDIVAETMTINCAREEKVDFSSVYYEAHQEILVPDNSTITGPQDLRGKRVCAPAGSTSLQNLAALKEHIQLWAVNDETDCLVMLEQGQVDAISTDDAILVGLAAQDPNARLVNVPFSSEPYGMAISKSHTDFTSFVNGVLAEVRENGTWANVYNRYLAPYTGTPAPTPPLATYR